MKSVKKLSWPDSQGFYDNLWRKGRIITPGSRWWFSQMDPKNWPPKAEKKKP